MKIFGFPDTRYGARRYFPVVAILAAVATLILLLVIYTSRNLSLARQRLEESLLQEGLTLIRAIEAGSRTGMRMQWAAVNHLQILIEEISDAEKIAYISVIGADGKILAHSQSDYIGKTADVDLQRFRAESAAFFTKTITLDQSDIFEITAALTASTAAHHDETPTQTTPGRQMGMGRGREMGGHHGMGNGVQGSADIAAIQIGMKMTELRHLQQNDLRNAVVMVIVLSIAGSAALYFIVFLQNYSTMNYAFQTMKSYAQYMVDSMANGLISLDTAGNVVTLNRQACRLFGIDHPNIMQGKALTEIVTIQDFDPLDALRQGKSVIEQEVRCTPADTQNTLPVSLSASVFTDDHGNQLGAVLLFRDLSDVKALQEQVKRSEKLASVGKLAAGVAHEIRNPLGALKGFLQYFQRKLTLQEQDQTYLTVMVNEVDRLNAVISNLLEFARPKDPTLEPCDIVDLIRHIQTLIEADLQAQQLRFALDLAENLPPIRIDRDQMTQVLLNILLNAIQATPPGGQITFGAHLLGTSNQLELSIADTGQGMSAEELSKIFDPFFTTKKRGAGLGLAIAYSIVEQHHGEIMVESKKNAGSTFRIRLPLT